MFPPLCHSARELLGERIGEFAQTDLIQQTHRALP